MIINISIDPQPYAYTEYHSGVVDIDEMEIEFNICSSYDTNISDVPVAEDITFSDGLPEGCPYTEEELIKYIKEHYNDEE